MRGYPKSIKTRHDLDVALQLDSQRVRPAVQAMLNERKQWCITGQVSLSEGGVNDATHKVVEVTDDDGAVTGKYQYELQDVPSAALFRVGLTVQEAQDIVGG
jgi:hypothetical protein